MSTGQLPGNASALKVGSNVPGHEPSVVLSLTFISFGFNPNPVIAFPHSSPKAGVPTCTLISKVESIVQPTPPVTVYVYSYVPASKPVVSMSPSQAPGGAGLGLGVPV